MSVEPTAAAMRCDAHPARPAHDRCPRCRRPRCDADAARYGVRCCGVCSREPAAARVRSRLELLVRAGLAGLLAALLGGWIATQYVEDHVFSLVVPGLLGLAASWAAGAAVPRPARSARSIPLAAAIPAAVLGTGLGFRLVPGGRQSVLHPFTVVGAPYLCAVLGAVAWSLLMRPPRQAADRESRDPNSAASPG